MSGTVAHGKLRAQVTTAMIGFLTLALAAGLACAIGRLGTMGQIATLALATWPASPAATTG